jgi:8-amino-7-oxononanoate synthase
VALCHVVEDEWRREHLQSLIQHFRSGAQTRGLELLPSNSPIQPLVIGSSEAALNVAERLQNRGFLVVAIRPPTVRKGTARLRITLSSAHQLTQLDALLDAIAGELEHD